MSVAKQTRARPEGCCELRAIPPLSDPEQARMVQTFKALADPTRLEILRLVAAQPSATCVCDIVDHFDRSQPTISHHLKILREAGLLRTRKEGIWSFYELEPEGLSVLSDATSLCGSPCV